MSEVQGWRELSTVMSGGSNPHPFNLDMETSKQSVDIMLTSQLQCVWPWLAIHGLWSSGHYTTLQPWRGRQLFPLKRPWTYTRLYDEPYKKTALLVNFACFLPQKTQASCSYVTSVDFYQSTSYKIPKESTHEDLSFMFPARKSGAIPMRPGYGLAGRVQIWSKTSIWSARLCKVNWCLIHSNISCTSIDLCPMYQILPGHQKWKKNCRKIFRNKMDDKWAI